MSIISQFMLWWNNLASRNGKLKFRSQREAAEFVRRVQNEQGGPNTKIIAMRKRYNEVSNAKKAGRENRSGGRRYTAVP